MNHKHMTNWYAEDANPEWTLKILIQGQTAVRHVFLSPFLSLCNFLCVVVVSLCQVDSPVLLWPGYDNGALLAICNPPFDCLHQILHCNHNFTNLLGASIDKNEICLADSSTLIFSQGFFLPYCLSGQHSNHYRWGRAENKADTVNK